MNTFTTVNSGSAEPEAPTSVAPAITHAPLRESVSRALHNYLSQVDSEHVSDLYQMVLAEIEIPLLEAVMACTRSNQTRASTMLGLNRGTLRKKLKQYGML